MKLGVHIGYWGLGLSSEDQLNIVQEAERLGYDSVWAAEAYGSDTATVLGWLAGQTSKIRLGSGIFQMPARSPAMTAMTAATIDQLSNGRMIVGIGSSGPQVAEGWHGQRFARQLQRTREYVAVVRMALARERVAAQRDAPVHRLVCRRDGLAQTELLQPGRPALRLREGGEGDPGSLPRGQARGGDGGDPRRADRHGLAVRPQGARARAALRLPRRGGGDARRDPHGLHRPGASRAAAPDRRAGRLSRA